MSTTLFVDSACDLPQSFLNKYDIKVLPATILYDGHSMPDYRNTEKTIALYESGVLDKGHESDTAPTSAQTIQNLVEKAIKQGHQEILIQTVSRTRSPTFEHATEAANRAQKTAARNQKSVSIRVQDSRTVFAGQGVLAAHTVALLRKGVNGTALRRKVDRLSSRVHAYQVPADVFYLRERARRKGDNSISWLGAIVGRTLNIAPIVLALDDKTFPIKKFAVMTWRSKPCSNTRPRKFSTVCCRRLSASAMPGTSTTSPPCPSSNACRPSRKSTKTTLS